MRIEKKKENKQQMLTRMQVKGTLIFCWWECSPLTTEMYLNAPQKSEIKIII
jgi:hypothetical protein